MSKFKILLYVATLALLVSYIYEGYQFCIVGDLKSGIEAILLLILFFESIHKLKEED